MIKIKLAVTFVIANLLFSITCMDDKAKISNDKVIKVLELVKKNNYLSEAIALPGLQRIVAQYAQEWNCTDKQFAKSHRFEGMVLSPDGKYIASLSPDEKTKWWDSEIKIWNFNSKECTQILNKSIGHSEDINSLDFSPDNKYIVSAGKDTTIRIYDLINKKYINVLDISKGGHTNAVFDVKYSPSGKYIASSSLDSIKIWHLNTQDIRQNLAGILPIPELEESISEYATECNLFKTLVGHATAICKIDFSPDGNTLATGSRAGDIKIWDLKNHTCSFTYNNSNNGHTKAITDLKFAPTGQYLASSSIDCSLKLWDLKTNTCTHTFDNTNGGHDDVVTRLAYYLDGQYLFSGCNDGSIKVFNIINKKRIFTLDASNGGHSTSIKSIAFSPCGRFLLTCCEKEIKIWSIREFELLDSISQS